MLHSSQKSDWASALFPDFVIMITVYFFNLLSYEENFVIVYILEQKYERNHI